MCRNEIPELPSLSPNVATCVGQRSPEPQFASTDLICALPFDERFSEFWRTRACAEQLSRREAACAKTPQLRSSKGSAQIVSKEACKFVLAWRGMAPHRMSKNKRYKLLGNGQESKMITFCHKSIWGNCSEQNRNVKPAHDCMTTGASIQVRENPFDCDWPTD